MISSRKKYNRKNIGTNDVLYPVSVRLNDGLIAILIFLFIFYGPILMENYLKELLMIPDAEGLEKVMEKCRLAEDIFLKNKAWHYYWVCLWESNNFVPLHAICSEDQFIARFIRKCHEANFHDRFCQFPPSLPSTQIWLQNMLVELKEELLKQAGDNFYLDPEDPSGRVWLKKN